jgi:hypothetical protein
MNVIGTRRALAAGKVLSAAGADLHGPNLHRLAATSLHRRITLPTILLLGHITPRIERPLCWASVSSILHKNIPAPAAQSEEDDVA